MPMFYSPFKLLEIIKQSSTVPQSTAQTHDVNWFMSTEGKRAYDQASTVTQKALYFYEYLRCVSKIEASVEASEFLQKVAFIMANSMDNSNLEFAGYPNMLDETKNPILALIKSDHYYDGRIVADMLAALHHESDSDNYLKPEKKPYLHLEYAENGQYSDMYKIERNIIWMLATGESAGPFNYSSDFDFYGEFYDEEDELDYDEEDEEDEEDE